MELVRQGFAFSPVMKNSHRMKANFLEGQHLVLDFDNGDVTSDLATLTADDFIRQYAAFLYSTPSSTPEAPRSRAVFILSEALSEMEPFDKLARAMVERFPTSDQTVGEASRFLYGTSPQNGIIIPLGNVLPLSVAQSLITISEPQRAPTNRQAAPLPIHTVSEFPLTVLEIIQQCAPRPIRQNSNPRSRWSLRCPLCVEYVETETDSFTVADDNNLWHCFACELSGNAYVLAQLLGLQMPKPTAIDPKLSERLSFDEMVHLVGQHHRPPAPIDPSFSLTGAVSSLLDLAATPPSDTNVRDTVYKKLTYTVSRTFQAKKGKILGRRPALWDFCVEKFPLPRSGKPLAYCAVAWNPIKGHAAIVGLLSNTWLNPYNAQYKRQVTLFNLLPKLKGPDIYYSEIPIDDWTQKRRESLARKIRRHEGQWIGFDNAYKRGVIRMISSVPLEGWTPVGDIDNLLVDLLTNITPPIKNDEESADDSRFRPIWGSGEWSHGLYQSPDDDKKKVEILARSTARPDWQLTEANLVADGIPTMWGPPWWRGQQGSTLLAGFPTPEAVVEYFSKDEGFHITKRGMAYISVSDLS